MKKSNLDLIQECRDHWDSMASGKKGETDKPWSMYCALCVVYGGWDAESDSLCKSCPIHRYTGYDCCDKTPYSDAHRNYAINNEAFYRHARRMVNFLQVVYNEELLSTTHKSQILINGMRTPDGTEIYSRTRHDYVVHNDANGIQYVVDGGLAYIRRSHTPDHPPEDLSLVAGDTTFKEIRKKVQWGTYGKNGDQPLTYKLLSDISDNHLQAIIDLRPSGPWSWLPKMAVDYRQYYRSDF